MKKELLFSITKKDFNITWYSGSGAGGQYRNKHQNCCRIQHKDSGVIVTAQEERSQKANLKRAFQRMIKNKKFNDWLRIKAANATLDKYEEEKLINKKVDEMMKDENLKIEYMESL